MGFGVQGSGFWGEGVGVVGLEFGVPKRTKFTRKLCNVQLL